MKRDTKRSVKQFVENHKFQRQLKINQQTIQLLLHDPDFIVWAKGVRRQFNIPAEGFTPLSLGKKSQVKPSELEVWFKNYDVAKLDDALRGIYDLYTKVNESFLPYIRSFVLYDKVIEDPMFGFKVLRGELGVRKLTQVTIDVYFPLINEEWEAIKAEVNNYFEDLGISGQPSLIEHFDRKLVSLKEKSFFYDPVERRNRKQTDEDLITKQYPSAKKDKIAEIVRNLPNDRKKINYQIKQRLGKVKKQ